MTTPGYTVVALVPHPRRPALLTSTDGRTTLPTTTVEGAFDAPGCLAEIEGLLGTLPPVLRFGHVISDEAGDPVLVAVDLETIGPDSPRGFAWTDRATVRLDDIEPEALRPVVARWIDRREHGPTALDPPWAHPGWLVRTSTWMVERMAALGSPVTEPPRLVYSWGYSMVLRAPTADSAMYLKCSAPVSRGEPTVTAALAALTPDLVTPVAAIEPDEGWLLMYDLGDRVLGDEPPERWAAGLVVHARIQQAWTARTDELARAGVPTRSLTDLADGLPTLADREPLATELTGPDREAWQAALPAFADACRRLQAIGPPSTITHGDLHPWNVAATPDGPRIFDWTDAEITHPFLDLAVYATRPAQASLRREIRDAYLAMWTDRLGPAELAEAGDLALVVGTLQQVDSYVRMLSDLDPDDAVDLRGAAGSWARAAVDTLREGIEVRRPGHADG